MSNPTLLVSSFDNSLALTDTDGAGTWTGAGSTRYAEIGTQDGIVIATHLAGNLATPGLVAYWTLSDAAGATSADSGPNGHDGTNVSIGAETGIAPFNMDGAASFGSSGSVIRIPDHADFAAAHVSIEVWFSWPTGSWQAGSPLFNRRNASNVGGYTLQMGNISIGDLIFFINAGSGYVWFTQSGWDADTVWHLVVTYDGHNIKFYRNGILVGTDPVDHNAGLNNPASALIAIGNDASSEAFQWPGVIDDVAVYDVALDGATILAHYNSNHSSASIDQGGTDRIDPASGSIAFRYKRLIDTGAEETILTCGTVGSGTDYLEIGIDSGDHLYMEWDSDNGGSERVTSTGTISVDTEYFLYCEWDGTAIGLSIDNGTMDTDTRDAVEGDWGAGDLELVA